MAFYHFFALQERIDLTFADDYHKRVFGFISEFLLYVWVKARNLKAYECRVAVIGEKKETNEVMEKMADYFWRRDAAGAKAYFASVLKKRPDILMEASDINGECKLCLQAVSTANLELAEYGSCFLQHINDYTEIIDYFRGLNSIAAEAVRAVSTESEQKERTAKTVYVKTIEQKSRGQGKESVPPWTSDIAIRAAVRLYASGSENAERAYRYCKKGFLQM